MEPSLYIPDGYTLRITIKAAPGLWPEAVARARPTGPSENYEFSESVGWQNRVNTAADILARKLIDISVVDGPTQRPDADKLKTMHPLLFNQLFNAVMGFNRDGVNWEAETKNSPTG